MSLKDVMINKEYRSLLGNVVDEFFVPVLSETKNYKRSVGFFSSSVLVDVAKGINGLIKNNGKIQLIASPHLSDEDIEAIKLGYKNREEIIKAALNKELLEPQNKYQSERLNLLANLIADGYLDIRIAITEAANNIGMYHEKMGIMEDEEGNRIAFTGSNNASSNALFFNYEAMDVYCSWTVDEERVQSKEQAFYSLWNNIEPNVTIYEFNDITEQIIKKYKQYEIDYSSFKFEIKEDKNDNVSDFFKVPSNIKFHDYQETAIKNWISNSACGIFDMATGTGKTYTALGAITKLSNILDENIAVVIVAPYQHLVEQWVEDIKLFNVNPIVAYSYSGSKWRSYFSNAVNAYKINAIKNFCIITTNATFATDGFQKLLKKINKNLLLVIDEAHNFGAEKLKETLPLNAKYRLALSATIERYEDEEGTKALTDYFGKEPCIVYTLEDAISNGFLTSYYYYPVLVNLNEEELEDYKDLTKKIIRVAGFEPTQWVEDNVLKLLLIKRARIIAGCKEKVDKLVEVIKPFRNDSHMLVYCGATKYYTDDKDDGDEHKQIEEVNKRLYQDLGIKVRKFTASESKEERIEIREMFAEGKDLQVITAIKCLDEGVNIPEIKKAFILASCTNPKEYIQRRGRVLRKAPNKKYAEIYDFITLPRPLDTVMYCSPEELQYDIGLVRKEFARMVQFAKASRNPKDIDILKDNILNTYNEYLKEEVYYDE